MSLNLLPALAAPGARAVVIHAAHDLRVEPVAGAADDAGPAPGEVRVRIGVGGICGSDLHYYHHGGFGVVRLKEPLILGHEIAGTVVAAGAGVATAPGTVVAVNPSAPCRACAACLSGRANLCAEVRFLGSAMRTPHVQGAFCELVDCRAANAVALPEGTPLTLAALAEPFAVALHAVGRAGDLGGRSVLVAGAGPIGLLVVVAARLAGAARITVTDILPAPLERARALGVDRAVDVATEPLAETFDVAFDASGAGPAIEAAAAALRPGGVLVLVGQGASATFAISTLVTREVDLRGSFRFDAEFGAAARLIGERAVDLAPLLSHLVPAADAVAAFELASDKTRSMKVQLSFD